MSDPKMSREAEIDAHQEAMFDAMDMDDERLLAGGWDGNDSKDYDRLVALGVDPDDDFPF